MKPGSREQDILLESAACGIAGQLGFNCPPPPPWPDSLDCRCGVFVSLYVGDQLRGCIGTFSEDRPLEQNLKEMALAASSSDHRFESIQKDELEQLRIEISVLSPRRQIYSEEEIHIGLHGIYVSGASGKGTLLPQVAEKQGWDAAQFLDFCSRKKAGIYGNPWEEAEIFVYEAHVFDKTFKNIYHERPYF